MSLSYAMPDGFEVKAGMILVDDKGKISVVMEAGGKLFANSTEGTWCELYQTSEENWYVDKCIEKIYVGFSEGEMFGKNHLYNLFTKNKVEGEPIWTKHKKKNSYHFSNGVVVSFRNNGKVETIEGTLVRENFNKADIDLIRKSLGFKQLNSNSLIFIEGRGDLKIGCKVFDRAELKEFLKAYDEYQK